MFNSYRALLLVPFVLFPRLLSGAAGLPRLARRNVMPESIWIRLLLWLTALAFAFVCLVATCLLPLRLLTR